MRLHSRWFRADSDAGLLLAVGLLSVSLLALEVLFVRLVSIVLYPIATYLVISLALLGSGISGTILALRSSERPVTPLALSVASIVFSVTVGLALIGIWFAYQSFTMFFVLPVLLGLPFAAGGVAIALALSLPTVSVSRVYFADLLGAGLGVLAYLALIGLVGGLNLGIMIAGSGLLAAGAFLIATRRGASIGLSAAGAFVVIAGALVALPKGIIPLSPKELQGMLIQHPDSVWDYQGWNPIARIDVVSLPGDTLDIAGTDASYGYKLVTQDGGAPSILLNVSPEEITQLTEHTILGVPYWIQDKPKVLIIGLGGGPDVQAALASDAREITGVEINAKMIAIVQHDFADFVGHPYDDPRVTVIEADGRHILERSEELYDIIQMTGVDTSAASLGGNPNLAENYLYTIESFRAYLRHLTPGGTLSVSFPNVPGLGIRYAGLAVEALEAEGIDVPSEHIIISETGGFVHVLVKRTPFTEEEAGVIVQHFDDEMDGIYFPLYNRLMGWPDPSFFANQEVLFTPFMQKDNLFSDFLRLPAGEERLEFLNSQPQTVLPPTDDHPFFFVLDRWGGHAPNISALLVTLFFLLTAAVFFVLSPLFIQRRRGLKLAYAPIAVIYFAALGLGFILVEVVLIQKLSLFLGHPSTALTVTLATLLLSSGLGAYASGLPTLQAIPARRRIALAGAGVVVLILVWAMGVSALLPKLLGWPLIGRVGLAALLVALPGFLMGVPFPTGLAAIKEKAIEFVPWAWAINSVATVAGTVLGVLLAMLYGYTVVFLTAGACYAAISLAGLVMAREEASSGVS